MLDASKAFNRVNFWLLFQKLLSRHVPLFIVRILAVWYSHQKMCIRLGNAISPSFTVSNGVKQGGILSPILFNVYIDGLSVLLNSSNMNISVCLICTSFFFDTIMYLYFCHFYPFVIITLVFV